MGALRILVADDHDLMLRGIRTIIESHQGWTICGEARTGREAIAKADELKPDIAILDISMPDLNGLAAIGKIRKASPSTEILILSVHNSEQLIIEILKAGARGYIVKSDSDRDLVLAVEALAKHKPFFTSLATELILRNSATPARQISEVPESLRGSLTPREREIVQLLSQTSCANSIYTP